MSAGSAGERRAHARTAVVWDALAPILDRPTGDERRLGVLDVGGGTGGFAVRVAESGHRVTVVDPSPDALAALDRRARERGVQVGGLQGDLTSLESLVGPADTDLVLCHGVLEVVPDPTAALASIAATLRPGGVLSLLVAGRHAAVVARAMAGHFAQARSLLDQSPVAPVPPGRGGRVRRFVAEEVAELVTAAGLVVDSIHGVRVFADLVPGSLLDLEAGASAALVDLERAVARRPEYLPLATQLHVIATR